MDTNGFVEIIPVSQGKAAIKYSFRTLLTKPAPGKKINCFIPAFDIHFSVNNRDEVKARSITLTRLYIQWFLKNPVSKNPLADFVLQLHSLGYRAPYDALAIKKIINRELHRNVKFKSVPLVVPTEFADGFGVDANTEIELETETAK